MKRERHEIVSGGTGSVSGSDRNVLGSTEWSRMIPEHSRMVLSDHKIFAYRCWKGHGTSGKLFQNFQKCSGRFRKVPGSLWKYPEGYGTLQDAETDVRPSRKVHKVVTRKEKDFPWSPRPRRQGPCVLDQDAGVLMHERLASRSSLVTPSGR